MMSFSLFCLLSVCVSSAVGRLFLGPCVPPPKHVEVDLEKYAGTWYSAETTSLYEDKQTCSKVDYKYDSKQGLLNFVSGSKRGHLQKIESKGEHELRQIITNWVPSKWHLYVLAVDYDSIAVEYRCLDGALRKYEEVTILTRQKDRAYFDDVSTKLDLTKIIPEKFLPRLKPVNQENCPAAKHHK